MPPIVDRILNLLPAPLHRLALRRAFGLRQVWFRLCRPRLSGVRIVVIDATGRALLVRHSYGPSAWMAPGGHMQRGEAAIPAARREAREELGIGLDDARLVARHVEHVRGAQVDVHVVAGAADRPPRADTREIAAIGWFSPDALPADASPPLRAQLPRWIAAWHADRAAS